MLSMSSKSRIFLHNAHLVLFVQMDDTITYTNALVSTSFSKLELSLGSKSTTTVTSPFVDQTTSRIVAELGKKYEELCIRRGLPLVVLQRCQKIIEVSLCTFKKLLSKLLH